MKLTRNEFSALLRMFETAKDAAMAKSLLEMWLEENYYRRVYKDAWLDFCAEYDIKDDHWYEEENGGCGCCPNYDEG